MCNLQFLISVAGHHFYFAQRRVNIYSAPLSPLLGGVLQTVPLTARLISISSKSLWSSMAATSQRYSAVSDRVVLKIRMLAGSLSWALFSKSPFLRKEGEHLQLLIHIHSVGEKQRSLPSLIKVAEQPILSSMTDLKEEALQEVYLISCSGSTRNWGFHSWSFSTRSWGCLWR